MRRALGVALLMLAACNQGEPPPPVNPTTTVESTTSTSTTVETTATTEAPATTVASTATTAAAAPGTTAAPRTTVAEAELCPGLPHPAHHQPCPPATTPRTSPPATAPPSSEPCGRALVGVRAVGLPAGFDFYCGTAIMIRQQGYASAGLAGWNTSEGSFIAINPSTGDHPGVGAHEACHARDFVTTGSTSEARADACAAAHGYPNPFAGVDDVVIGESPRDRATGWLVLVVLVGALALIAVLLTLAPAVRRRLNRKDHS